MMLKNKEITYKIQSNEDWNNLKEKETLVDISNDSYFGFRVMEKGSVEIIYNPNLISSLVRIGKESKKFPSTTHNLILDTETLGFESSKSEEMFLKLSSRLIEELVELNPEIKLDFTINCQELDFDLIKKTLYKIYLK